MDLQRVQEAMKYFGVEAWLLFDFRGRNPIAEALTKLRQIPTRRWFCLIPAEGEPRWLVPRMERNYFAEMPGTLIDYGSRSELLEGLKTLLKDVRTVAAEYSPHAELPTVSFMDAGTFELVRSMGVEIVSSADLVHWLFGRVDEEGLALHRRAATKLMKIKNEAFGFIVDRLVSGQRVTEWDVVEFILQRFSEERLTTDHAPIVAVMGNSISPHYSPSRERPVPIGWGDFLLLDIFAKVADNPKAVYADITWCAYTGSTVPPRFEEQFEIVKEARDAAIEFLKERVEKGEPVRGFEVDDVARKVVALHGRASDFIHRTGHNLSMEVHGLGVNLDNYETHDTRLLVPGTLMTIEPGVYGPEIGTRTEINVAIHEGHVEITTLPLQEKILPLL